MGKFNKSIFVENLEKNKNIKSIEEKNNNFLITSTDDIQLYTIISRDNIHNFYTKMVNPDPKYYYFDFMEMPHETLEDLYQEVERFTNPQKRKLKCKYAYFKS